MGKILKSSGGKRGKFDGGSVPKANMKAGFDKHARVINPNSSPVIKDAAPEAKPNSTDAKDAKDAAVKQD